MDRPQCTRRPVQILAGERHPIECLHHRYQYQCGCVPGRISSTFEGIHIQYEVGFKEREEIIVSAKKIKAGISVKVKKGDTLQKLAKKYLGDKKKYKKIYKANKKLIDKRNKKEKKKNPEATISKYKIYKDQVLVIPTGDTEVIQNDRVEELKRAIKKDGYADLTVNKKLNAATKAAMKKISIRTGRKGQVVKFCAEDGRDEAGRHL